MVDGAGGCARRGGLLALQPLPACCGRQSRRLCRPTWACRASGGCTAATSRRGARRATNRTVGQDARAAAPTRRVAAERPGRVRLSRSGRRPRGEHVREHGRAPPPATGPARPSARPVHPSLRRRRPTRRRHPHPSPPAPPGDGSRSSRRTSGTAAIVPRRFGSTTRIRAGPDAGPRASTPRRATRSRRRRAGRSRPPARSSTRTTGACARWPTRSTQRTEADYRWFRFEASSELLDELDHNLKIADGVLRFRIFKVDPDAPVIVPPAVAAPAPARASAADRVRPRARSGPRTSRRPSRGDRRGARRGSSRRRRRADVEPEAACRRGAEQRSPCRAGR